VRSAVLSPGARRGLLGAVRWIARDNRMAAQALVAAIGRSADNIGTHPRIGVAQRDLASDPYRFLMLSGFPYILVYNADRDPPRIVRILHGARDLPRALRNLRL
jgi:toxin ParE1/3/4